MPKKRRSEPMASDRPYSRHGVPALEYLQAQLGEVAYEAIEKVFDSDIRVDIEGAVEDEIIKRVGWAVCLFITKGKGKKLLKTLPFR